MSNRIKMTLGYEGTKFTRDVTISSVDDDQLSSVKTRIKALNASVSGGTDGGLTNFFLSDDYDSDEGIGTFKGIQHATIISKTVENINLEEDE